MKKYALILLAIIIVVIVFATSENKVNYEVSNKEDGYIIKLENGNLTKFNDLAKWNEEIGEYVGSSGKGKFQTLEYSYKKSSVTIMYDNGEVSMLVVGSDPVPLPENYEEVLWYELV